MTLIMWFAAVAVVLSPFVLWWAVSGEQVDTGRDVTYGGSASTGLAQAGTTRLASASGARLRQILAGISPDSDSPTIERRIAKAGLTGRVHPNQMRVARLVSAVIGFGLAGLVLWYGRSAVLVIGALSAVTMGLAAPLAWLSKRAGKRQLEMRNSLPDALDQMTILSRAGLGLQASLTRTAGAITGPLAEELGRTAQDLELGVTRARAFESLADRTSIDDIRRLVVALDQASRVGAPIGDVLKAQADHMRSLRQLRAEERAQKMIVKLTLPLVLCILPTLFLVVLGPAVLQFRNL